MQSFNYHERIKKLISFTLIKYNIMFIKKKTYSTFLGSALAGCV